LIEGKSFDKIREGKNSKKPTKLDTGGIA